MATREKNITFENYNPTTSITSYISRFKLHLQLLGVTSDAKKSALLLTSIGAEAYEELLQRNGDPSQLDFDTLCGKLEELYGPHTFGLVERYKFHQRHQQEGVRSSLLSSPFKARFYMRLWCSPRRHAAR